MYKIHVFDELFYPISNCCYANWNNIFFPFPYQPLLRRQIPLPQLWSLSILTIFDIMEPKR